MISLPDKVTTQKLHLTFDAVDTWELSGTEIVIDGTQCIFKVGEGEVNHFIIPNAKKLCESQFEIICKGGEYFVRDLGIIHTSRVKVSANHSIQLRDDALVDIAKTVSYHFDRATHNLKPTQVPNSEFLVLWPTIQKF